MLTLAIVEIRARAKSAAAVGDTAATQARGKEGLRWGRGLKPHTPPP